MATASPEPPPAAGPPGPDVRGMSADAAERWIEAAAEPAPAEPVRAPAEEQGPPSATPPTTTTAPPEPPPPDVTGMTPDAAEHWIESSAEPAEAAPEEAPPSATPPNTTTTAAPEPPSPDVTGMTPDAAERWLESETEPDPEGTPLPVSAPTPDVTGMTPDAAERWLEAEVEAPATSTPPPAPTQYTPCSSLQPYNPDVCIGHPAETYGGGDPFRCVPGEGPADDSCRTLTADEFEDPPEDMIWCHPLQGPYMGTRPCSPGEEPPPEPPAINAAPIPSDDYESWRDPSRRWAELRERYGEALPTSREWETPDFQEREQGRLRFGLFIADEETSFLGVGVEGDNRDFDPEFSPHNSRAYLEVDFENDHAYVVVNPTCHAGGGQCNDAKHVGDGALGDYSSEVTLENRDDGSIYIQYELSNSRLPAWIPFSQGPSIDGHITVTPNDDETFTVNWFMDPFPSNEAYFDDGCGTTYTLIQNGQGSGPLELNPLSTDRDITVRMLQQGDATC